MSRALYVNAKHYDAFELAQNITCRIVRYVGGCGRPPFSATCSKAKLFRCTKGTVWAGKYDREAGCAQPPTLKQIAVTSNFLIREIVMLRPGQGL